MNSVEKVSEGHVISTESRRQARRRRQPVWALRFSGRMDYPRPSRAMFKRCEPELSSLSTEDPQDAELVYTMRDLTSKVGHTFPGRETRMTDRDPEGRNRPHTPGTPTFPRRVRRNLQGSEPDLLRRCHFSSTGFHESPLSPSISKRPWSRLDPYDSPEDQDKEYVGFATLPNQVHRKSVKKGFAFTLMVAGESGLGKSTLVNSLFLTDVYKDRILLSAEERITKTVEITKHTIAIEEKGVKLKLTIVDTPGFGDALNNTERWKPIVDFVDHQFEQYFRDESGLNRKNIQDNRVHCCLYFISPYGHGLRPVDVEFMRALHEKVNLVPVLGKADCLTPLEVSRKKKKIREEIERFGINIYQFNECDSDEENQDLKDSIPFAVVGSNVLVQIKVENPTHSDFLKLRNMLVRTHMQDLKDVTQEIHYENYRSECIRNMTRMVIRERKRRSEPNTQEVSCLCNYLRESAADLPLVPVDDETERLIWEKDEELQKMLEMLQRMQEQVHHGN
ncbi:septin 4a isoform X3 [Silurus meridionalis]|uniref:septin 4a isoform X3 n=1 Tax=Silurus meridionalis TaxID=175797 RepID=UPI001EEA4B16|nr:septin 4a isoform X3 [Silurus meridionalis]